MTAAASAAPILLAVPRLLYLEPYLREVAPVTLLWEQGDPVAFARSPAGRAVRVLVTGSTTPLSREMLDALGGLEAILYLGAGYESVDTNWARERGIMVANTPGLGADDVADLALTHILAHVRRLVVNDALIRAGEWRGLTLNVTQTSMGTRRVGIVGLGAIGEAVARRVELCRSEVRWWGRRPNPDAPWPRMDSLEALAEWANVLVVAVALKPETHKLIDAAILRRLGPDGVLVNVSRGGTVDEEALRAALRAGEIGGAGLDVFDPEPTDPAVWVGVPNTTLSPHCGGRTDIGLAAIREVLVENAAAVLRGERVLTPVPELA